MDKQENKPEKKPVGFIIAIVVLSVALVGGVIGAFFGGKSVGYNEGEAIGNARYDEGQENGYKEGYNVGFNEGTGHCNTQEGKSEPRCSWASEMYSYDQVVESVKNAYNGGYQDGRASTPVRLQTSCSMIGNYLSCF